MRFDTERCSVVVIGAGPYGLSAAAHLIRAGVSVRVFGGADGALGASHAQREAASLVMGGLLYRRSELCAWPRKLRDCGRS